MTTSRLLRTPAQCPDCGKRPRIRIVPWMREAARSQPREERVQTYQCHHCGHTYPLTAGDLQDAA